MIGVCKSDDFGAVKAAGFDYVEINATPITLMSEADFERVCNSTKEAGIAVMSANGFLPENLKVTGSGTNESEQMTYVAKCFGRLNRLGVKIVVFGSGRSRNIPDGFAVDRARAQVIEFCRRIGPLARTNGLTVVVEPLNRKDCNLINTVREGLEVVEAVNDPNIELLADLYHMFVNEESPEIILNAGPHLKHVHIANPKGRVYPASAAEFDYKPFLENLRKIGFSGGISIEGRTNEFKKDAPRAVVFLREMLGL